MGHAVGKAGTQNTSWISWTGPGPQPPKRERRRAWQPQRPWAGTVYIYGSCHQNWDIAKPMAGYGVVLMKEDDTLGARVWGGSVWVPPDRCGGGSFHGAPRSSDPHRLGGDRLG